MTSIGPGPESVDVQLFAPSPTSARWDIATWDGASWASAAWQSVDCDVVEASFVRGVTDEAGVLSQSGAGPMDLSTLDPNRELDPSNADGPYFGSIAPGTPIRLLAGAPSFVGVWAGWIDEATYDVATQRGRVRCIDAVAQLAQAQIPDGTVLPNTLRARVRAIVSAVGLGTVVSVAPEVSTPDWVTNPSFDGGSLSGWQNVGLGSATAVHPAGGGPPVPVGAGGDWVVRLVSSAGGSFRGPQPTVPTQAGVTFTASGWTRRINLPGSGAASLQIRTRDIAGTLLQSSTGNAVVNDGSWEQVATSLAITNAATATVELWCALPSAAGETHEFDALSLIGPDLSATLPDDPPVAPFDGKAIAAWTAIQNAALDALTLVWLDPDGMLRFTSWGGLPDAAVSIGCAPAGDTGTWLGGLSTVVYGLSSAAIRNRVRAYSSGTTWSPYQDDAPSIARYGARPVDVDRVVPDFANWSARILADRADAGLTVTLGEVRPYSQAELAALLAIGATGPQVVRIADADHPPPIDDSVGIVGTAGRVTSAGWSFRYVTSIPRVDWDAVTPKPPDPPIPPPQPYHTETRTYIATSDALLALTSGGAKYGAGASSTLPVGAWSGWTYRSCIQLPAIPWTAIRRIVSAKLRIRTTTQVRVGFGSSPTIEVQRITGSWSAGSSSSPSSGNAVVYPGPTTTSAGAKRSDITKSSNVDTDIDITAIATAWAPSSIGGSAAPQRGVMLLPGSGSTADTTEVWPVEQGGAARPSLILTVEVFD